MLRTAKILVATEGLKAGAFELLLDELKFGNLDEDTTLPLFSFFGKDGTLVTKRYGTKLITVTASQFHAWGCAGLTMKPATA
jgi:hypothetical protein